MRYPTRCEQVVAREEWTTSRAAQNDLFVGWSPREPNNVNGLEHCASLETNSSTPEWFDRQCHLAEGYACESE
jgi:hypothetical protein